jgi:MFS family permease
VLFTIASLACGFAQNDLQLIIARVVQGLAGGIFVPAVTAFIQLLFPPRIRGRAFAIMGSVIGVSAALGPILGGLIISAVGDENGWRLVFWATGSSSHRISHSSSRPSNRTRRVPRAGWSAPYSA